MPAAIFSGTKVKLLKKIADLFGGAQIHSSTTNPTTSAVSAPIGSLLLNESTGDLYRKLDAGSSTNWALVGSESVGQTNIATLDAAFKANKPANANAELSVGDWLAYADAAAATPVDMTGGSPNTTITRNTTTPLDGAADFRITVSSGATRQGEGVSLLCNVPRAYRGQVLTLSMPYKVTGTISSGDFVPYAYDVTNSVAIAPTIVSGISSTDGRLICTIVTATTTAQLRVGVHVARAVNTGAVDIYFDDVVLSAVEPQANVPMSDWAAYTPTFTGFGTVSTSSMWWRRVGDSVEIKGTWTNGTTTATEARVSLPNGIISDSAKVPAIRESGIYFRNLSSVSNGGAVLIEPGVSYFTFGNKDTFSGTSLNPVTKVNGDSMNSADPVAVDFISIPISGWSSGGGTSPILSLSDWKSYTPTGSWVTNTTYTGFWRRVGDSIEVSAMVTTSGAPTAAQLTFGLPSGLVIDTAKLPAQDDGVVPYVGEGQAYDDGVATYQCQVAISSGGSPTTVAVRTSAGNLSSTNPFTFGAGDKVSVKFKAPISGWTSTSSGTLTAPRSEVVVEGGNGHGSTGTKIRRFDTQVKAVGAAISYADSATDGGSFTINEAGVYAVTYLDFDGGGADTYGISVNASSLTTDIGSLSYSSGKRAHTRIDVTGGGSETVTWIGNLSVGDVVRAHGNGGLDATNAADTVFTICKVSN